MYKDSLMKKNLPLLLLAAFTYAANAQWVQTSKLPA
jgi:hypothetical protein